MRMHLICVGTRMPRWVAEGFDDYARRFPRGCDLRLVEIPKARHGRSFEVSRARAEEAARILAAIPPGCWTVALDGGGSEWSTEGLAGRLGAWMQSGLDLAWIVGGVEGLDPGCRSRVNELWSLSPLTFPHAMVRLIVVEQLYRACSILRKHPYHRG